MNKLSIVLMSVVLLGGCAYIDQNLKLDPQTYVASEDIGKGMKITLKVVDDRDDQMIGRRVSGYGMAGAKIDTNDDITTILEGAIREGLTKKGFTVDETGGETVVLKVTLRALKYEATTGIWTAGNNGQATIKVIATNAVGKDYERSYRADQEIRTAFIGSQETNAKVINGALGDAVNKIFEDKALLEFLTK